MLCLKFVLETTAEQYKQISRLQLAFASLCNELSPFVSKQQCWNRVTLHHLQYKALRQKFPHMGSQMVCNAIYAVCKVAKLVYQHPSSPYHLKKLNGQVLPIIRFANDCPVYFDSHTLALVDQNLSMYTMVGRTKFELNLTGDQKKIISSHKLIEITLNKNIEEKFMLTFYFRSHHDVSGETVPVTKRSINEPRSENLWPTYVGLELTT